MKNPIRVYGEELGMVIVRAVYGFFVGLGLSIAAMSGKLVEWLLSMGVPPKYVPFMEWIPLALLYVPSIAIAKMLGVRKLFNLVLRGASVYVAIAVLVHVLTASP